MNDKSSEEYSPSPDEINARGRELYPRKWTGREVSARDLPPPARIFRKVRKALDAIRRERAEAARKKAEKDAARRAEHAEAAKRASVGVGAGPRFAKPRQRSRPRSSDRPLGGQPTGANDLQNLALLSEVAKRAGLSRDIVEAAQDEAAYREDYSARRRGDKVVDEILRSRHGDVAQPIEDSGTSSVDSSLPARRAQKREQGKEATRAKYKRWRDDARGIMADKKIAHPLLPIEIARHVVRKEKQREDGDKKADAENIRRRLNDKHPVSHPVPWTQVCLMRRA